MGAFEAREVRLASGERIRLRRVTAEDAVRLLEFLRREAATTDQVLTQPDEFPQNLDEERAVIAGHDSGGGMIMGAEHGEALIGLASIRPGNRRRNRHAAVFGITVAEAWRGRGVGTAIIRALLEWAREHEFVEKVCLQVFSTNPRAMALYETLGFVEEGRVPGNAKLGPGRYVDDIHMGQWVKPRS